MPGKVLREAYKVDKLVLFVVHTGLLPVDISRANVSPHIAMVYFSS